MDFGSAMFAVIVPCSQGSATIGLLFDTGVLLIGNFPSFLVQIFYLFG